MESQRVKCLTEGYLRGWLTFDYKLNTSRLRENIVLNYIQEERLYSLLQNRLFIETVLRGTAESRAKGFLDPVFDVSRSLVGLKLPSALPKDKIEKNDTEESKDDLSEWKAFLETVNKK